MIVTVAGQIELDDDPERIDVRAVHAFMASDDAYWTEGRSLSDVERLIAAAARVLGAYDGDTQVGFARVVSDRITFAYLDDVYVAGSHRRRGIGEAIVRTLVDGDRWAELNWVLFTRGEHQLYARVGFGPAPEHVMIRHPPSPDAERADADSPQSDEATK